MELQHKLKLLKQTKPGKKLNLPEKDRILMQYAGIFPNNIEEYANKVIRKHRKLTNHSR